MKQDHQENWDEDIETEDDHSERVSFRQVMMLMLRLHDFIDLLVSSLLGSITAPAQAPA